MKILYIGSVQGFGNASRFYMIPQKLVNGFTRNDHNVYPFNDRDYARSRTLIRSRKFGIVPLNRKVLEVCADFRPDLVLLGHCEMIWNRSLEQMRRLCPGVKVVYRNVDPLNDAGNVKDIERRAGVVDGIFLTTAGARLKRFARPETFVAFMPNPVDPSIETGRSFAGADHCVDLFFAGGPTGSFDARGPRLRRIIQELPELRLAVHGAGLNQDYTFGQRYLDRLAHSKMGLSLSKSNDHYFYASDRMAQYLGNGLLTFLQRGAGFEELFEEDELAYYQDEDELLHRLRYFQSNDEAWRVVAERGWRKAHAVFDCKLVARYMIETIFKLPLSQDYRWPTEVHRVCA
jgi:hypothetical protein